MGSAMTYRPELDPQTAERLLSGSVAPDDAPPGFAAVAALFAEARPTPEGATTAPGLDALVTAIRTQPDRAGRPNPRRSPMLTHLVTAKVAAVIGAVVLGVGGAAAAGALPASAQDTAHDVLEHVGVTVPGSNDSPTTDDPGANHRGSHDNSASETTCDAATDTTPPSVTAATDQHCTEPTPIATGPGDNQTGQVDETGDIETGDNETGDNETGDNQTGQVDESGDNQDRQDANDNQSDSTPSMPGNPTGDPSHHDGDQSSHSDGQGDGGQQGSGD
jgi:hypothetical protein